MKISRSIKMIFLSALLVGAAATPALAQISINIGVAPPPPRVEVVPVMAPDRAWAPGYWAWTGNNHVWVRGRPIMQREGYNWSPDRWEKSDNGYHRQPGFWVRDTHYVSVKKNKPRKLKMDKHGNKNFNKHGGKNKN